MPVPRTICALYMIQFLFAVLVSPRTETKKRMPWNPGLSYDFATYRTNLLRQSWDDLTIVADGRFQRETIDDRPGIHIRWVGAPPANPGAEPVSLWFRGAAYRNLRPLRWFAGRDGDLWGVFPVDVPSPNATAADVLADHNAGGMRGPPNNRALASGWDSELLAEYSNQGLHLSWMGTMPAERDDWLDFADRIGAPTATSSPVAWWNALAHVPVRGWFATSVGRWSPAHSVDPNTGRFLTRSGNELIFTWMGNASDTDSAEKTDAVFWYNNAGYTGRSLELIRGIPLRATFRRPGDNEPGTVSLRGVTSANVSVMGCWDSARRLSKDTAVVMWHGPTPWETSQHTAVLQRVAAEFYLEGTTYRYSDKTKYIPLYPERVYDTAPFLYGVFKVNTLADEQAFTALQDPALRAVLIKDKLAVDAPPVLAPVPSLSTQPQNTSSDTGTPIRTTLPPNTVSVPSPVTGAPKQATSPPNTGSTSDIAQTGTEKPAQTTVTSNASGAETSNTVQPITEGDNGWPVWAIVLVVVGCVTFVALGIYLVLRKNHKKNKLNRIHNFGEHVVFTNINEPKHYAWSRPH